MNKEAFVSALATKAGTTKKEARKLVSAFLETLEESLIQGEKIQLMGFGTFEVLTRKGRRGVNPRTAEKIYILPMRVPKFTPGMRLKGLVKREDGK